MISLLISVIIPNYNHAPFLRKRVESVLQQTYQNIEVILLDDCSTDDSRDVLSEYQNHPRVSNIIFNNVNSGSTFKQWKKGIEIAKGDWIWIAESDDWCEPTLLTELITPIYINSDITLSFCQSVLINPQNEVLYTTISKNLFSIMNGQEFVAKYLLGYNRIINASMVIFKKKCFENISPEYMTMIFCGDWFIWANICMQGRVFISGKFLNYYLRHNNNIASSAVGMGYELLEGNKIFSYILGKLDVSAEDKNTALNNIINTYLRTREMFINKNVHYKVWESMIILDPSVQDLIDSSDQQIRTEHYPGASRKALNLSCKILFFIKNRLLSLITLLDKINKTTKQK